MARTYQHNKVVVRRTNGLEIICANPTTIYIKHKYGITCYDRWFMVARGFYSRNWKPFRHALLNTSYIDMAYVNKLAERYSINVRAVYSMPDLSGREVRESPEKGRRRNAGRKHSN